jgi:hypothetical protein
MSCKTQHIYCMGVQGIGEKSQYGHVVEGL